MERQKVRKKGTSPQQNYCVRCQGSGWVCEVHRKKPMNHILPSGKECGGAGLACEESCCPFRTHPTDAEVAQNDVNDDGHVSTNT
jgi:hypothetical protein